jgi:hypothetical protein
MLFEIIVVNRFYLGITWLKRAAGLFTRQNIIVKNAMYWKNVPLSIPSG